VWLAFFRDLAARRLSGVALVASDANRGLTKAIGATLPGAAWQRSSHYAANLMSVTLKSTWGWVRALLHSVYDQSDAASVHAQFGRVLDALEEKLTQVAAHWMPPAPTFWPLPRSRRRSGGRSGPTTRKKGSTARSAAAPTSSGSSLAVTP
jgi:putative transposase